MLTAYSIEVSRHYVETLGQMGGRIFVVEKRTAFYLGRGGQSNMGKRKLFNKFTGVMIAVIAAIALGLAPVVSAASFDGYKDVKQGNDHYDGIKALTEMGVIQGYTDGTFDQWGELERRHAAVMLYEIMGLDVPLDVEKVLKRYSDMDGDSLYAEQIAAVTEAGIFAGYKDKTFKPAESITRQQMATAVSKALDLNAYRTDEDVAINLENVNVSHKENVQILANLKITNQLDDFRPGENISRGAFATLLFLSYEITEDSGGDFTLSIMHMNDTHAHVEPFPQMITAIKEVREEKPDSLLFHAGDVFSGTLYFNEFKGQADLALMNLMDIDAMVFGNHEFDLGDTEDGQKSLSEFVKNAKFPLLNTNTDFSKDAFMKDLVSDERMVEDPNDGEVYHSIVKEVDGEKIGIFGLTTEDTKDIASPANVTFADYKKAAEKAVKEFEDAGINKIVAVNHIGYDSDPSVGNDLLLAEIDGIDVIVGGHSHTKLEEPAVVDKDANGKKKDPTVIVQAYQYAEFLGTLEVEFDGDGVVVGQAGELLEVANYDADPEAVEVLQPFTDQINETINEEIGAEALKELTNPRQDQPGGDSVRANETELGNLVTDAMLAKAKLKDQDIQIAVQNGGGIREAIAKGPITTGEVISVLPFGNNPVRVKLSGKEIKEILEHSVRQAPGENGGFLHVSGMKFTYDSTKDVGDRVQSMKVKQGDVYSNIDKNKTYSLTTNAFTAQGGDGFETFAKAYEDGRVKDLGETDWEQLRDYMVEDLKGKVDPKIEGRIVDVVNGDPGDGGEDPGDGEDPGNGGEDPGDQEPIVIDVNDFSGTADNPKKYDGPVEVNVNDGIKELVNANVKGNLILTGTPSADFTLLNIIVDGDLDISGLEVKSSVLEGITVNGNTIL